MTNLFGYMRRSAQDRAAGNTERPRQTPEKRPEPTIAEQLAFEATNTRPGSAKDERIREQLGITPARHYQLLGRQIWGEEALDADPMTTNRLRRQQIARETERARRTART